MSKVSFMQKDKTRLSPNLKESYSPEKAEGNFLPRTMYVSRSSLKPGSLGFREAVPSLGVKTNKHCCF